MLKIMLQYGINANSGNGSTESLPLNEVGWSMPYAFCHSSGKEPLYLV